MPKEIPLMRGRELAVQIVQGADRESVNKIIGAINALGGTQEANVASVLTACASVVAQTISLGGEEGGALIRAGFLAMLDGYPITVVEASDEAPCGS